MTESELRFALALVTEGSSARATASAASETFSTEAFRRESTKLATRSRPWVLGSGIQGLGVGEKIADCRGTGELALRVYVETKKPSAAVDNAIPKRVEITELGECPTDVLEIGRVQPEVSTGRDRPAMPGSGVSHPDCGVGTFGCLVREKGNGDDLFILSNAHVLADEGCAQNGDIILQPGLDDGGDPRKDVIAEFARAHPFVFSQAGFDNLMDAAIARVTDPGDVEPTLRLLGHPIRGVGRTIKRGMEVMKVGRTTDHTIGIVQDVDFRFHLDYKSPGHRSLHFERRGHEKRGRVGFREQVLCTRYTAGGDSGSAVLNRRGYLVGLHFAGSPSASVFSPIRTVFRELGLELHRA